jgi:ketosteroid isomerase-like protein
MKVMERVSVAWEGGDYETLRSLLHPYVVVEKPRMITDPDELVDAIRDAQQRTAYQFRPTKYVELSEHVLLGTCTIRTAVRGGGHIVAPYVFLLEVRDELFYRRELFPSQQAAHEAFESGWESDTTTTGPSRERA